MRQLLLGLGLAALAQAALAVGFGRLPSTATLGQPLQLSIPVRLDPNEELRPECMAGTVYYADIVQQPGTTSVALDPAPPGVTDRTLRLTTTTRVDEPVVTVEISLGCSARVVRRFTLFADPPLVTAADPLPTVVGAAQGLAPSTDPSAAAQPAPAAEAAPVGAGGTAQAGPGEPTARLRVAPPRRRAAVAGPTAARPRQAVRRPAPPASARLRLIPIESGAVLAAAASSSAAASAAEAAASAAAAAAAEEAASAASAAVASRRRVEELEAAMKRLQAETSTTQQQIGTLQSRLQRAEGDRYSNPLIYALVALIVLLVGAVLWLWRQRQQEAEAHAWLVQAAAEPKSRPRDAAVRVESEDLATAEAIAFAPVPTLKAWVSKPNEVDGFDDTLAATRAGPSSVAGALTSPAPLATAQKREVSVEELIDLEQQAEFFVVLGQDAAAIELLLGHLRSTAGSSPLPYLKLLEIYKRRGDRGDYEKLRERFNSRFNAYAPAWETDLQDGRSLDDYPTVVDRLQNLWSEPQRAMEVLQASLLRAEGGDGSGGSGAGSFDLPAYRELMLLYSVARDRSEAEHGGAVDLLLPIGDIDSGSGTLHSGVFERLLATTTLPAQPDAQKPLEVDLTLDDLELKPPTSGGERQ